MLEFVFKCLGTVDEVKYDDRNLFLKLKNTRLPEHTSFYCHGVLYPFFQVFLLLRATHLNQYTPMQVFSPHHKNYNLAKFFFKLVLLLLLSEHRQRHLRVAVAICDDLNTNIGGTIKNDNI